MTATKKEVLVLVDNEKIKGWLAELSSEIGKIEQSGDIYEPVSHRELVSVLKAVWCTIDVLREYICVL